MFYPDKEMFDLSVSDQWKIDLTLFIKSKQSVSYTFCFQVLCFLMHLNQIFSTSKLNTAQKKEIFQLFQFIQPIQNLLNPFKHSKCEIIKFMKFLRMLRKYVYRLPFIHYISPINSLVID